MTGEKRLYAAIFIAEAITAWLYFSYIYSQRKNNLTVFFSFALAYASLYIIAQLNIVFLNVLSFFLVNTILLKQNYYCEIKSAILHSSFLTLAMGISEVLVNLYITSILNDYTAYTYSLSAFASLFVFSKLAYFFVTIFAARFFKPHKGFSLELSQLPLLCAMPLVSVVVIVAFIYVGISGQLTDLTEILIAVSVVLMLFVNIIVLLAYNCIQKLDEERATLQVSQIRDQADAEYYQLLQQQYDEQRILIHDIRKHFGVIDLMAEDGNTVKIREYISELERQPEFKRKARLCDDPILNMVLLRYSELCSEKSISFSCDVRSDSVSFMDATSITALFGNLLSNAVEAAEKSEEKSIDFSITYNPDGQCVIISLTNSCDIAPRIDSNGNYKTSKRDQDIHGYGIKSIERVVRDYNGMSASRYDYTTRTFHYTIRFPVDSSQLHVKE